MLHQCTFVLEGIALAQVVEFVVKVLVNLAGGTILDKESTEDPLTAHPEDLAVETKPSVTLFCSSTPLPNGLPSLQRTLAFLHQLYPSSYQILDVCRSSSPQPAL
jgi:hypothetical protein